MVGDMKRPVDYMILGLELYFSVWQVSSWMRSNTLWNTVIMDKAFYNPIDGGFSRNIAQRIGKSETRISIYSSKGKMLSLPWRKWSNIVNLLPGLWLVTLQIMLYLGLSVGFCRCQIWHSAVAVVRSALVSRRPCCWAHAWLPSLPPWPTLFMDPLGNVRSDWGRDWQSTEHSIWLLNSS